MFIASVCFYVTTPGEQSFPLPTPPLYFFPDSFSQFLGNIWQVIQGEKSPLFAVTLNNAFYS